MSKTPNIHLVVGPNRQCLCGTYGVWRKPVGCNSVLEALQNLKNGLHDQPTHYPDIEIICEVIEPLQQDCSEPAGPSEVDQIRIQFAAKDAEIERLRTEWQRAAAEANRLGNERDREQEAKLALRATLEQIRDMPNQSIWEDNRDDAANSMVFIAESALRKRNAPNV